jgi:pimeloyl-ACP methyl ester carboxylesterase
MAEKAVTFGKERSLVGVLSPGKADSSMPAVLLLNAGLVHRVGPSRMNVDLARRAQALGFDALRYDQSGFGDSEVRRDDRTFEQQAVDDAVSAMDHLRDTRGRTRFVLIGLCSGAVNAHHIAVADERVCGAVFIDGYAYRAPSFYPRHVLRRALSPKHWKSLVGRASALVSGRAEQALAEAEVADEREGIFTAVTPPQAQVGAELGELARRGVRMLEVFTSAAESVYNADDQFFESFPDPRLRGLVEIARYPLYDHTFTLLASRREFFDRVTTFLRHFVR